MPIFNDKFVNFHEYCPKCEYKRVDPSDYPCFECMGVPVLKFSHKPINFKEKKE